VNPEHARPVIAAPGRFLLFAAVWWALAEGRFHAPLLALGVVLAATVVSLATIPASWRAPAPAALARFGWFMLRNSTAAGIDVARRALHPRLPISPGFVNFMTVLPAGAPRAFLAATIGLLPGSLCAELDGDRVEVHLLDATTDAIPHFRELERVIEPLFRMGAR
jgi:multicomponent Na+:H+ antiporter subunit E